MILKIIRTNGQNEKKWKEMEELDKIEQKK